ncbi:hypothetical protein [Shewanella halotolerans]|uniref:hypothetical protein n=1 Tax=Shewanella halotolerans TaxID=2864204 RepID=UPI001C656873|nr:hypothetical protein [Shewanella halotolerans]QYJ89672.1 hypothetical protein K0H81_18225 [Shewanella halotolerans]
MPQWLIDALRSHEFTADEKASIAGDVVETAAVRSQQAASVKPTEADRQRRYNM